MTPVLMDGHAAGPADLENSGEKTQSFDTCGEEALVLTGESEGNGKKTII